MKTKIHDCRKHNGESSVQMRGFKTGSTGITNIKEGGFVLMSMLNTNRLSFCHLNSVLEPCGTEIICTIKYVKPNTL